MAAGLLGAPGARAQEALAREEPPLVAAVHLAGELGPFGRAELAELLRTQPNRRFLGLPGLTPSLWLYRLGEGMPGALGRALTRAGEPPATLDSALVAADAERLTILLQQEGYLEAEVEADIDTLSAERVAVTFRLAPGPPSTLRRVRYEGLEALAEEARRRLARGSALRLEAGCAPEALAFAARNQRFSERQLLEERRRLLAVLRDEGYAAITRDSIRAVAFPVDSLTYDVAFQIWTGPAFRFGDVAYEVTGPEEDAARADTFAVGDGRVSVRMEGERVLGPGLLLRTLRFEPGQEYRLSALQATKRRLERTGVFAFSEITPGEAAPPGEDGRPRLPHRISLRTRPRHSIRLEGFLLQRTSLLGAEGSDELGLGAGATYRNLNTFGRGEAFAARLGASVAGDLGEFPTSQIEASTSLAYPYLVPPLGFLEDALEPYDARTRLSLGFLTARRDELRFLIRGRATAGLALEVQHSPTLTSALDLVDFRLSDPDTLAGFSRDFLELIEDPVARQLVLEDYTRPQVNNALRYTLRSVTADLFRRERGHAREAALEVGGNLPYLLDRFVFSPGTIEGSLPGLPLLGGGTESRLEYRQYVRLVADARQYVPLSRLTTLAARASVGVAHPTGGAPVVPFDRRFYVGGAHSVRGWRLHTLGPGGTRPGEAVFVQGGDVKLELGLELRTLLLRRLFAADWQLAFFSDAGNVWFGPRNPGAPEGRFRLGSFHEQIALGAGLGLRLGWDFLILRLDLAWPVHSPVPGEPWFPEGLRRPLVHFGLGQAF